MPRWHPWARLVPQVAAASQLQQLERQLAQLQEQQGRMGALLGSGGEPGPGAGAGAAVRPGGRGTGGPQGQALRGGGACVTDRVRRLEKQAELLSSSSTLQAQQVGHSGGADHRCSAAGTCCPRTLQIPRMGAGCQGAAAGGL
jgi:hypothetical protein